MAGGLVILMLPLALFGLQRQLSSLRALRPVTGDPPLRRALWIAPALLAVGHVLAVPSIGDTLSLGGVLDVNGPWALSAWEILGQRLDPRLYIAAWAGTTQAMPTAAQVPMLAGVALFCAVTVTLLAGHGLLTGGRLLLAMGLVTITRVFLIVTGIVLTLYTVHLLNFWLLAVAIVVIQVLRSRGWSGWIGNQPRTALPAPARPRATPTPRGRS